MLTRIKICCISSVEEAAIAIGAGADALGLVGKMPSGPGPIEDALIAAIAHRIPPAVSSFLLTSEQSASAIVEQVRKAGTSTVQIVDELTDRAYRQIREELPNVKIVQVIHVTGNENIDQAIALQEDVDAILLDSGNPRAAVKTLGGTGNVHDWVISRSIVEQVTVPVFLAGGLHAGNVQEAIHTVQPFAVDVCSGVRTGGKLDPDKVHAFVMAVRSREA